LGENLHLPSLLYSFTVQIHKQTPISQKILN